MLDILIKNARIVDGTGNPWFWGDIAIADGRIAAIGHGLGENAHRIIDAEGRVASPGFIDIHSHDDVSLLADPTNLPRISQGITTVVTGNCGISTYPAVPETLALLKDYVESVLTPVSPEDLAATVDAYAAALAVRGTATNVASLIGHGPVRIAVMGYDDRRPDAHELQRMKVLVTQALARGAFGLSIGLLYAPGSFADIDELVELAQATAASGGLVAAHVRTYETYLMDSVQEFLEILRRSGVAGQLSHLQAGGSRNWGKVKDVLRLMNDARKEGIDVTCDMYPYAAGSTTLTTLLPPWALTGGMERLKDLLSEPTARARIRDATVNGGEDKSWESKVPLIGWRNIMVSSVINSRYKAYEGKNLEELALALELDPFDALVELILADHGRTIGVMFSLDEKDIEAVYASPLHMVGSDGMWRESGNPHPRLYGAFARVLSRMVREKGVLTLEQAVQKMTSRPARRLGLVDRGLLRPGLAADIVIFDPEGVEDTATFAQPRRLAAGFSHVIVNGRLVFMNGQATGETPGLFLRRGHHA